MRVFLALVASFSLLTTVGLDWPLAAAESSAATMAGRYTKTGLDGDALELQSDGTFALTMGGDKKTGTYTVQGNLVTLTMPRFPDFMLEIVNGSFTGPDNQKWQRIGAADAPEARSGAVQQTLSTPALDTATDPLLRLKILKAMNNMKQLYAGCALWASHHHGTFPSSLDELFVDQYLGAEARSLLVCPLREEDGKPGYFYYGRTLNDTSPDGKILLMSKWTGADKKRLICHKNGSLAQEEPRQEDFPAASNRKSPTLATPPTLPAPSPPPELSAEVLRSLVIVEGERLLGSGFIVRLGSHSYLVTNAHVVRGQLNLSYKNLSNQDLHLEPLQIAEASDLVRAEIAESKDALEAVDNVESHVKIGDEVIVAGNSEGAGVVRELTGRVLGIGPDRIEVDAPFVSGNSGSPILLKSTGQVIAVATYQTAAKSPRNGATALNEVRRFGYRLDSVSNWIAPPQPDHLTNEGIRLNLIEDTTAVVRAIQLSTPATLARTGPLPFISKKQASENPGLASLSSSIDDFANLYRSALRSDDKKRCVERLCKAMSATLAGTTTSLQPEHFSGYYALTYKRQLEEIKVLQDWFESSALQNWMIRPEPSTPSTVAAAGNTPPTDPATLDIHLLAHSNPKFKLESRYRAVIPVKQMPLNKENLYWIITPPSGPPQSEPLLHPSMHLNPTGPGLYKVSLEYRFANITRAVSNVVEFSVP